MNELCILEKTGLCGAVFFNSPVTVIWDIEYAKDSRISGVPALENWKEDPRYQIKKIPF